LASPPTLGELNVELAKFEKRILAWLPKWEIPTIRASLLVIARAKASTTEEAYEILKRNLVSVNVKPGKMTDLVFRVNWKTPTKAIEEGYYNRLTSWFTLKLQGRVQMGPDSPSVEYIQEHFAQVEMDINTPAERAGALPPDRLQTIYEELFKLAGEI